MELRTTYFSMEWPPGSGQRQEFPEIDRVGFFSLSEARERMKLAQHPLLDRLVEAVASLQHAADPTRG